MPILLAGLPPMRRFPGLPAPVRHVLGAHARRRPVWGALLADQAAPLRGAGQARRSRKS